MQVSYSSLGLNKQDNKQKIDSAQPVITQTHTIPNVAFTAKSMLAAGNLKAYYLNGVLTSPKLSFGYLNKGDEITNKPAVEPGCNYNKEKNALDFGLLSENAGRVELWVYKQAYGKEAGYKEVARIPLDKTEGDKWVTSLKKETLAKEGLDIDKDAVFYGYRVWGKDDSNWKYDPAWTPGSDKGFVSHVDDAGNRFNPNKLVTDPEATEISHDPVTPGICEDGSIYASGEKTYKIDTAPVASKSVFVMPQEIEKVAKPTRPLTKDNIYEVHVKGFTASHTMSSLVKLYDSLKPLYENDPATIKRIDEQKDKIMDEWKPEYAGTYKGASFMAPYLKLMGFTMVEFLPVQEYQNSEKDNPMKNYWGYMTHSYKAPDRQLAADRTPGGPTKEFQEMANEFHKEDIKVGLDVVYNHTAEGGCYENPDAKGKPENAERVNVNQANEFNLRAIDNTSYYRTDKNTETTQYYDDRDGKTYKLQKHANQTCYDNKNGCGADLNAANPIAQTLVLDTLKYWKNKMGVDAFRFDLAPVLGNTRAGEHDYYFDSNNENSLLKKTERQLNARSKDGGEGVDLIAEPWGCGAYEVGKFSSKYSEWNDKARNVIRSVINKFGVTDIAPVALMRMLGGSKEDMNNYDQPKSVNSVVCHDGFTLHDLFAYNYKQNYRHQSDGGTDDNISWDQGGDKTLRKQAVRTAMLLIAVAKGTPMIAGGDERYRTTLGNNNPWNIDGPLNYIDWGDKKNHQDFDALRDSNIDPPKMTKEDNDELTKFTSRLFNFRKNHPALTPTTFSDNNKITWYDGDAKELHDSNGGSNYWNNPANAIVGFKTEDKKSNDTVYVVHNKGTGAWNVKLPANKPNKQWFIAADTSSDPNSKLERENIKAEGKEVPLTAEKITCNARSAIVFIEKDKVN